MFAGETEESFDAELERDHDLVIAFRDFKRVTDSCSTGGFVEGVEVGKKEGVVEGFSSGFVHGLNISSPWAILKGRVNALKVYYQHELAELEDGSKLAQYNRVLMDLEKLSVDIRAAETQWKESSISTENKRYQKEVTESFKHLIIQDRSSSSPSADESVATETEDSPSADVSVSTVTEDAIRLPSADESAVTETESIVKSCDVKYDEVIKNMNIPPTVKSFEHRLNSLLSTS